MPSPPEAQATPTTSSDQLLAFVHYLRGKKIPVSPADTLDAIEVVELTGYADKTLLKNGLAACLLYTSPSPRDKRQSRMPSSA